MSVRANEKYEAHYTIRHGKSSRWGRGGDLQAISLFSPFSPERSRRRESHREDAGWLAGD
ncbi:hypothetical protein E2C01_099869 [Portunus trituberculatus]|uniref:Uncharacterized protein n=1 Tax=Portunus trituberculatus TaxID=210409 RepID=A0A5B7KHX8_PORTR|nr:hypothetical protein [Portunus trituberculatus]